ncbi:MAG: hypothetical protein ACJ75S_07910, partial [Solirubrobacterales bacterium]
MGLRLLATAITTLALAAPAAAAPSDAVFDCTGPAGDPAPDTPAWHAREQANDWCGEQRAVDTTTNPAYAQAKADSYARHGNEITEDPFRDPALMNGSRFRYQEISYVNRAGQTIPGALFRPCDSSCKGMPPGLHRFEPPYPGVVVVHGGAANQEMYLWGAEGLAEAGYMVMTFQIP